jgi:hypothetical protein
MGQQQEKINWQKAHRCQKHSPGARMRGRIRCKSSNIVPKPRQRHKRRHHKRSICNIRQPEQSAQRSHGQSVQRDCSRHLLWAIRLQHQHLVVSTTIILLQVIINKHSSSISTLQNLEVESEAVKVWHLPSIQQTNQSGQSQIQASSSSQIADCRRDCTHDRSNRSVQRGALFQRCVYKSIQDDIGQS